MSTIPQNTDKKQPANSKKPKTTATGNNLHHLAFDNTVQPNIITDSRSGKIITANKAACKLLGYSKKELLTKSRAGIFDINEDSFKEMLKQRTAEGQSIALVTAIKKSGNQIACEITSAVFMDENGIEKAITSIADMSQRIQKQKNIDAEKEKIVADNIALAKSKQKRIDIKKEKVAADNIVLAKSEQKEIDTKKEKIVVDNIVLARSKQKEIDVKKEKVVADNIALAKAQQKKINIKKEKVVADNIILAQAKSDDKLAENSEWIRQIAKASYDVMWDWDIVTGKVYIGDSIEEVFGYKLKDNTTDFTDLSENLLAGKKNTVAKRLMKILASSKISWKDSYNIKRQDGSIASVMSRASIVRDGDGKAIKMIGATQDVSKLQELEKGLEDQKEKFYLASKLSFDVIWEWNIVTNELYMGEGFEELFGYTLKNNKSNITDWRNYLPPDDKEAIERGLQNAIASSVTKWEHAHRFTRADGSIFRVFNRASIIRDADGKACRMIGAMQDVSRQKELEEKLDYEIATKGKLLTAYKESFKLIFNSSSDVLYDVDLVADEVIISDAYEKEFGYKITSHMTPAECWVNHIHPGDKKAVMQDYLSVLASDAKEWKYSYRFLRADNSVANVISNRVILRDADGKAYRILGSMHDVSKQKVLEEKLAQEIKLKEKQIAEAAEDAKETERADIGKELHDNVNQLLAVSKLYLDMAKQGGPNSEIYLGRSSEYTMTAIEEIRKLSKGLTTDIIKNIGLCEAIDNIIRDTMEVNPVRISFVAENFKESSVNDKFRHNVFRIVQEQLNNILKHAKATDVVISLSQNNKTVMLTISDNGVGFDTAKKRKGIGLDNIKSRAVSYKGAADFVSQPGQGCVLRVIFPVTDALLKATASV